MTDTEEKDVQAFTELQNRVLETSEKQKFTQQQLHTNHQLVRRAVLTATELEKLSDSAPCYEAVGRAYVLAPRAQVLADLEVQVKATSAEIKKLEETQDSLKRNMEGVERDVRELLQNSPALARAFASASQ